MIYTNVIFFASILARKISMDRGAWQAIVCGVAKS